MATLAGHVLYVLFVLFLFLLVRQIARRLASRRRLKSIGEPAATAPAFEDGARLTLRGILEIDGSPARRYEDGAERASCVVVTRARSSLGRLEPELIAVAARAEHVFLRCQGMKVASYKYWLSGWGN